MVLFDPSQLHEQAQAARRQQKANETTGGPANVEPDTALAQETPVQVMEKEHVFFLLKPLLEPLIRETEKLYKQLRVMVEDLYRSRHFIDTPVSIGATIAYEVDYHERHMLFVYTTAATTFVLNSGGTLGPTTANTWFNISVPRGTKLTIQGGSDAAPATVIVRATDVSMV